MVAILVSGPASEPVTREEAKAHARVDGDAEDVTIDTLIAAARSEVESRTGRALVTQGWRIVRDGIPRGGVMRLAPAPVQSVDAVTVYDGEGHASVVPASDYQVDLASQPGRLAFTAGLGWQPRAMNGLEVDLTVGYGPPSSVPAPLKHAVLMLVAHWFEHREAGALGALVEPVANGVSALLAPYRLPRLS